MAATPPPTPAAEDQQQQLNKSELAERTPTHLCHALGAKRGLQGPEGVCGAGVAHAVWNQRLRTHRGRHEVSPGGHSAESASVGAQSCLRALWGVRSDGSRPRAPQVEFPSSLFASLRSLKSGSCFSFMVMAYLRSWRRALRERVPPKEIRTWPMNQTYGLTFCLYIFARFLPGSFTRTSGGSGTRRTRTMTSTTLFVVWSRVSGCRSSCPPSTFCSRSLCNCDLWFVSPQLLRHVGGPGAHWLGGWVPVLTGGVLPVLPALCCTAQQSEHRLGFGAGQRVHGGGTEALRAAGEVETQTAHHWESTVKVEELLWFVLIKPPSVLISNNNHPIILSSRYVLGYKGNARQQCVQSRGPRASGVTVVHVVTTSCSTGQLQSLLTDRLLQVSSSADTEIQVGTTLIAAAPRRRCFPQYIHARAYSLGAMRV